MTIQTHEKTFEIAHLDCGHQMKVEQGARCAWCTWCGETHHVEVDPDA